MQCSRLLVVISLLLTVARGWAADRFFVHEWGTFTSLQEENGLAIGGINTDDEPVPDFVHDLAPRLLIPPTDVPPTFFKGAPGCHPGVTMRLETPVIYFHAPNGLPEGLSLRATFHGGWLTQFYPNARSTAPGIDRRSDTFGALTPETTSTLEWRGLTPGWPVNFPSTTAPVWLAPRAVGSTPVRVGDESEQFLFYRGVGNIDAPLKVVRHAGGLTIQRTTSDHIRQLWLADVRPDGTTAFRKIDADPTAGVAATVPAEFPETAYSRDAATSLRAALRRELVAAGLHADEAEALLQTWKVSYFESPGLRLFFLVPRTWTDRVLSLEISGSPGVVRVMVGRIEIVTPAQRELLRTIATSPLPDPWRDVREPIESLTLGRDDRASWNRVVAGETRLADLGVPMPGAYSAYLALGRFRNALVLDEQRRHPSPALDKFISTFSLSGFRPE